MVTIVPPVGVAGHNSDPRNLHESLADFESALLKAADAYRRWIVAGFGMVGQADLSPLEAVLLLVLAEHNQPTGFAELCAMARVTEPHLAHYALRKLQSLGLIQSGRQGKAKIVSLTAAGQDLTTGFQALCRNLPDPQLSLLPNTEELARTAADMRRMAEIYDQRRMSTPMG